MVGINGIWQSREANVLLLPGEEIYLIRNYDGDKTFLFLFAALHKHHQIVEMGICRAMQAGGKHAGQRMRRRQTGKGNMNVNSSNIKRNISSSSKISLTFP